MDNKWRLLPCTAYETIRPWIMRLWYMNELWTVETSLQDLYVFQITCKGWSCGIWMRSELLKLLFKILMSSKQLANAGHFSCSETIFTSWEQFVANVTVNCLRFLIHYIVQIRVYISEWSGDWLALAFLACIKPSKFSSIVTMWE